MEANVNNKTESRNDEIMDSVRERLSASKIVDVNEDTVQLVFFTLLGSHYALHGSDVKEILYPRKITPIPGTPSYLLGLINVRGDVESVLDFNLFLNLSKEPDSPNKRILIAEKNGLKTGIMVGSIVDVVDIPKSGIGATIATLNDSIKDFVVGETKYKENSAVILELSKIFQKMDAD